MNKSHTPLILLALSIAVAGCTALPSGGENEQTQNQVTFTQNDGLSISFTSATAEYFSGDQATFTVDVQNTGEGEARLKKLQLFGASWAAGASKSPGATLEPVETENNLPGGRVSKIFNQNIDVNIPQGQSDSYTVGLETTYDYTSRTRSSLTIMSTDRFRNSGANRQQMKNDIGGAPVHIRFKGMTPFPDRGDTITVPVEVVNVGDGEVKGDITLTVKEEGGSSLGNCGGNTAQLFEGRRTFTCQFDASGIDVPEKTSTLIATADYTYVEEDSTSVTVVGEGSGSDSGNGNNGGDSGAAGESPGT